jgi:RNA polymerase sigma-70 factor (ECF subfamily)
MGDILSIAESVFREQSGRILAGLIRISGSFDLAEDALQESFTSALNSWTANGIPANPGAWILTVAHRKLIDAVRRERTRLEKQDSIAYGISATSLPNEAQESSETEMPFPDDRLRLMFTCCHPALNVEAQVALTLRTLGGLSTPEIARAFLLPEPTLAQRLVRAKRKIQEACIPYEVPRADRLAPRLAAVQSVVYLIFNEGYAATFGTELVRKDLCAEAIRLGRVLCELLPEAENIGLLSLMLLHDSRRNARVVEGALVTLDEQDRSRWDRAAISEGLGLVDVALRRGPPGPYQVQAAIAALHAEAPTAKETDWRQIAALYEKLLEMTPSSVVALNHAAAIAMSGNPQDGLRRIDDIGRSGELDRYYLWHSARADLLRRLGRNEEAADEYRKAAELTRNVVELRFLERRMREIGAKATGLGSQGKE